MTEFNTDQAEHDYKPETDSNPTRHDIPPSFLNVINVAIANDVIDLADFAVMLYAHNADELWDFKAIVDEVCLAAFAQRQDGNGHANVVKAAEIFWMEDPKFKAVDNALEVMNWIKQTPDAQALCAAWLKNEPEGPLSRAKIELDTYAAISEALGREIPLTAIAEAFEVIS